MSLDNKSGERRERYDEISGDCKADDTSTGEGQALLDDLPFGANNQVETGPIIKLST